MNELIGKYLNGYKIVKIEKDPFIKGQINLWTDDIRIEAFGDRTFTRFYVREENNAAKVYQELVDKEKYELQQRINTAIEFIDQELQYHLSPFDYKQVDGDINTLIGILRGKE